MLYIFRLTKLPVPLQKPKKRLTGKQNFCVTDENGEKAISCYRFSDKNSKYMPKLNDEGIFCINYFGEYISGQKRPAAAQYAFVLGAAVMNDMDDEVSFNLVFQDGSKKICKVPNGNT